MNGTETEFKKGCVKGIVFTEFIELVEGTFSMGMVGDILDDCDLESGGAYTSVGLSEYHGVF